MAIYHYFESKQALLESMAASIVDSVYQPEAGADWKAELSRLAVSYVDTLRAYPGLLEAMLASPVVAPVELFTRRFLVAVEGLGADQNTKQDAMYLLVDYLHGFIYAATCATEDTGQLQSEDVVKPLRLLFAGMQTDPTSALKGES